MRSTHIVMIGAIATLCISLVVMTNRTQGEVGPPPEQTVINLDFLSIKGMEIDEESGVQMLPNRVNLEGIRLESIARCGDPSRVMLAESLRRVSKEQRQGLGVGHLKFFWENKGAIPAEWKEGGTVIYFPQGLRRGSSKYLAGLKWTVSTQCSGWDIVLTQTGGEFVDGAKLDARNSFVLLAN